MDGVDVSPEVCVDDVMPVFEGCVFDGACHADAGVVDEDVYVGEGF